MFGKTIHIIKKNLFVQALLRLLDKEGLEYAGYISYLNFFSIFPLFVILISSFNIVDETKFGLKLVNMIISNVPDYASSMVNARIHEIINGPPTKIISFVFIGALWTTTSSLEGIRTAFNKIYELPQPQFFLLRRLLTILQFIITIILFLITILTFTILPKHITEIANFVEIDYIVNVEILRKIISFIIIVCLVCSLYYSLTNRKLSLKELMPGAIINVVLWILTAKIMSYLLWSGNSLLQFNIVYGSLGGIILALTFFYIANLTLLYGASFNFVLHRKFSKEKAFAQKR